MNASSKNEVALFVTCLIDSLRPDLGFSIVNVIEQCGYSVVVPDTQSCCGQPNFNGGDRVNAKATARHMIDIFEKYDYTVIASGSCGGMIKHHRPLGRRTLLLVLRRLHHLAGSGCG